METVAFFEKQIFCKFWELVLGSINAATNRGILVKILGHEKPNVLFPRVLFYASDDPAQHEVTSIKCSSNVKYCCIRCMYNSRDGTQYDIEKNTLCDMSTVEQMNEGDLKGDKCNAEDTRSLKYYKRKDTTQ